jgi:hypothetical protein
MCPLELADHDRVEGLLGHREADWSLNRSVFDLVKSSFRVDG